MGKVAALARSPLGRGMSIPEVAQLSFFFERREFAQGEPLFRRGEEGKALFLVCDGGVDVRAGETQGAVFSRGEVLGEMSLLEGSKRQVDARATKPASVLTLKRDDFLRMADESPYIHARLAGNLWKLMGEKIETLREEVAALASKH